MWSFSLRQKQQTVHKNIVSKTWVRMSATNMFYSNSKFKIIMICENVDIEYLFIKIQLTLNLPFYHLVKKKSNYIGIYKTWCIHQMRFTVNHFNIKNVKLVLVNPKCVTFIKPIPPHYIVTAPQTTSLFNVLVLLLQYYHCFGYATYQYKRKWDRNLTYGDVWFFSFLFFFFRYWWLPSKPLPKWWRL